MRIMMFSVFEFSVMFNVTALKMNLIFLLCLRVRPASILPSFSCPMFLESGSSLPLVSSFIVSMSVVRLQC